jgi:serine/threonine protein kinase
MPIAPLRRDDPRRAGSFRIRQRLGAGGMGEVFLAADPSGQLVALKMLRPDLAGDEAFRRRFSREVAAIQRVAGHCTARLIDADLTADHPWLATEFVDGPTLGDYVRDSGELRAGSLTALAVALLEALAAIHAAGVIHRDLTPSNVILASSGPKVVDFGIAHHVEASRAITVTGATLGTPAWMSPEQVEGRRATPATDVFSWGAVVAFAGLGRSPFGEGRPESIMYRIVHAAPDIDELPDPPLTAVGMSLRKTIEDRPGVPALLEQFGVGPSQDLAQTVERTLDEQWTIQATPPVAAPRRRLSRVAWLAAAAVPVLIGVGVVLLALARNDASEPRRSDKTGAASPQATTAASVTTALPTPEAPPSPSPEDLWAQPLPGVPAGAVRSPVARIDGLPVGVTALPFAPYEVRAWEFHDGSWVPKNVLHLDAGETDLGIQAADVTGEGAPDFVLNGTGANSPFGQVVSNASGSWRSVPFESPNGDTVTENPTVQGNRLVSYFNTCVPDCAGGSLGVKLWTYDPARAYFKGS